LNILLKSESESESECKCLTCNQKRMLVMEKAIFERGFSHVSDCMHCERRTHAITGPAVGDRSKTGRRLAGTINNATDQRNSRRPHVSLISSISESHTPRRLWTRRAAALSI